MPTDPNISNNEALLKFASENRKPEIVHLNGAKVAAEVIAVPTGVTLHSAKGFLDPYLPAPEHIKGNARLTTLDSFTDHVLAFKDETTAVFANCGTSSAALTAVYDYHAKAKPAFCYHKAFYTLEVSKEWQRWAAGAAEPMSQDALAEFIEGNALDLLDPPTFKATAEAPLSDADQRLATLSEVFGTGYATVAKLLEVARGVEIVERSRVQTGVNTSTGERTAEYMATHGEGDKRPGIPGLFLIAIPVFKNGALYRLPVRLKYAKSGGEVAWSFEIYRADQAFDSAVEDVVAKVMEVTALPVYYGTPECN